MKIEIVNPPAGRCLNTGNCDSESCPTPFTRFIGNPKNNLEFGKFDLAVMFGVFAALVGFYFLLRLEENAILSAPDGDVAYYWLWARAYLGGAIRAHHMPLWNPYIMSGTPFLATNQAAMFYPLNWLYAILPVAAVLNAQMIFHFWFGLASMYLLTRRLGRTPLASLVSAMVFGFSGFAILHWWQGHLPFVTEWPWTPLIIWAWLLMQEEGNRFRGLLAFSALLAVQFFSGHPQIVYFTLFIAGIFQVGWLLFALRTGALGSWGRGTFLFVMALAFAGLLCAAQALPTALYSKETVRSEKVQGGDKSSYFEAQSQPVTNIVTAVAPWAFGGRPGGTPYIGTESYWEVASFVGSVAVLLTLTVFLAPRFATGFDWTCGALLVFSWWLAFGQYGFLFRLMFHVLPGLSLFRNPGRIFYVSTFAFALLSASGFDRLSRWAREIPEELWKVTSRIALGIAIIAVLFMLVFADGVRGPFFMRLIMLRNPNLPFDSLTRETMGPIFAGFQGSVYLALGIGAAACALIVLQTKQAFELAARTALCALLCAELIYFARPYAQVFDPEQQQWPERFVKKLPVKDDLYRIGSARAPSDLNQGMTHGVRHVWGYEPTVSYEYATAMGISQGVDGGFPPAWMTTPRSSTLTNLLGMRYVLAPPGLRPSDASWQFLGRTSDWLLFENPNAMPRAFTVASARVSTDTAHSVNSSDFEPTSTVLLKDPPPEGFGGSTETTSPGTIIINTDEPEKFSATVDMKRAGWFILMDQFLPGWTATIDGQPGKIYSANDVGRGLPLSAGKHSISMIYDAPGFALGARISIVAWGVWLLLGILSVIIGLGKSKTADVLESECTPAG